jgi:hypothetical protein
VQRHFGAFGDGEIDWRGGGRAPRLGRVGAELRRTAMGMVMVTRGRATARTAGTVGRSLPA